MDSRPKRYLRMFRWLGESIACLLARTLGAFVLLNLLGDIFLKGFDANWWWIDLQPVGAMVVKTLLVSGGLILLGFSFSPHRALWGRLWIHRIPLTFLAFSLWDSVRFYKLLYRGEIGSSFPIAFSVFVAGALLWIVIGMKKLAGSPQPVRRVSRLGKFSVVSIQCVAAGLLLVAGVFLQMICFGKTDYRRPADAIVVFGAGVSADGTPSDALTDRVKTGIQLYKDGYADKLFFSGGPGPGAVHETQAMRDMALEQGVPLEAISLDRDGRNTRLTVQNTAKWMDKNGMHRLLAVSHFYHLPRVKLAFTRAGVQAYTVPARERCMLTSLPYYMAREAAAMWAYWLKPPSRIEAP